MFFCVFKEPHLLVVIIEQSHLQGLSAGWTNTYLGTEYLGRY